MVTNSSKKHKSSMDEPKPHNSVCTLHSSISLSLQSGYDVVFSRFKSTCIECKSIMSRPSLLQRRWMNRTATDCDDTDASESATARPTPQVHLLETTIKWIALHNASDCGTVAVLGLGQGGTGPPNLAQAPLNFFRVILKLGLTFPHVNHMR